MSDNSKLFPLWNELNELLRKKISINLLRIYRPALSNPEAYMVISMVAASFLATQCAPTVAPTTILALAAVESRFDPLVINDNSSRHRYQPHTRLEAQKTAAALITAGHSVDMGLAQINSRSAPRLGLSIADAFDPCRNLAAAARLMTRAYRRMAPTAPSAQHALARALSSYNSGDATRGFRNGYVARVYKAAAGIAFAPRQRRRGYPDPGAIASSAAAQPPPPPRHIDQSAGMPAASLSLQPSRHAPRMASGTSPVDIFVFSQPLSKGESR